MPRCRARAAGVRATAPEPPGFPTWEIPGGYGRLWSFFFFHIVARLPTHVRALRALRRVVHALARCAAGAYARWSTDDQDWPQPRL